MRLLRNYFLKEFLSPMFMSLGVFCFVMALMGMLQDIADKAINKGVDILSILKLLLFMMPYIVTYALPIAVLIAILLSLGRLSSDNEIIAIRASGINILRLIFPLLVMGLILSLSLVVFNDRASAYAHFAYRKTLIDIGIKNPTALLEEGTFINSFDKYILFVYHVDHKRNRMNNVRIYEPQSDGKPTRTIIAKAGEFIAVPEKNTLKLKLIDGTSDEPDPENPYNFYKLNFKTYFMNLNIEGMQKKGPIDKKPKDMTLQELRQEMNKLRKDGINAAPIIIKLNERLALAFSCLAFILIGSSLAIITRRREKSINIGLAVLVIIVYYPLLLGCEALGIEGTLNPWIAMWIPNMLLASIGGVLTIKICAS